MSTAWGLRIHPVVGRVGVLFWNFPANFSALVLGLGMWLLFPELMRSENWTVFFLISIQVILFLPLGFKILWPITQVPVRALWETARGLGASPWKAFWSVEWPRWRSPLLSVFLLVFGTSLGELAAVSLLSTDSTVTLPLLISRLVTQYRFEEAQGVGLVILGIGAGAVFFAQNFVKKWGTLNSRVRQGVS
jgi:ABC-type Fe3+ transport system permease subunit